MIFLNNGMGTLYTEQEWAPMANKPSGGIDWSNCSNSAQYMTKSGVCYYLYVRGKWAQIHSYSPNKEVSDVSSVMLAEEAVLHFHTLAALRKARVKLYYNYN